MIVAATPIIGSYTIVLQGDADGALDGWQQKRAVIKQ
jgi:hypothetical protein